MTETSHDVEFDAPRRRRWYVIVAVSLWTATLTIFGALIALANILSREDANAEWILGIGTWAVLSLGPVTILWTSWVVPFMASSDLPRRSKHPPAKRVAGLGVVIFILPIALTLIGGLALTMRIISTADWSWKRETQNAVLVTVAGVAMLVIAWWIASKTVQRLKRAAARQRICFRCGYDLRASTGACPECGDGTHLAYVEAGQSGHATP